MCICMCVKLHDYRRMGEVVKAAARARKDVVASKKRAWEELDPTESIRELTHGNSAEASDSTKVYTILRYPSKSE